MKNESKIKENECDGCCYRRTCDHDLEKCCYLVRKNCIIKNEKIGVY